MIKLDPNNYRIHPDKNKELINKSLKDYGAARSIVVDNEDYVIAGNGVYEQAKALGLKEKVIETDGSELVIVKRKDVDHNSDKRKKLAVLDNKASDTSLFDMPKLELDFTAPELNEMGFEIKQSIKGLTDEDEVPEVNKSVTKKGDIWLLGKHRILCGDSTVVTDIEKLMNDQKAELLFTSPPYSDMREYNGNKDLSINHLIEFIPIFYEYAQYQIINLGIQRKNGEIFEYWNDYIVKAKNSGYKFLSWNVWAKDSAGSIGNQSAFYPIEHEWIFVFGKEFKEINRTEERKNPIRKNMSSHRNKDGSLTKHKVGRQETYKELGTVLYCASDKSQIRQKHPAVFPVELPEKIIETITNINDIVIEPFCGSGSTLIACEKTNRICYGMELDEHYCDVIIERWQNFTGQEAILASNSEKYNEIKELNKNGIRQSDAEGARRDRT